MGKDEFIALRHSLHSQPEVSGKEQLTSNMIAQFLKQYRGLEVLRNVGGSGLLAIHEFGPGGKTILLRCELDALPIQESNDFSHRSQRVGVSHKCGHDGHMAILVKVASRLGALSCVAGRVILLFQPAEETGEGAQAVLNDTVFQRYEPDHVLALHNLPGYDIGSIVLKEGQFNAEVVSVIITLTGRPSHASEPEKGVNPAMAIADIVSAFSELHNPSVDEDMRYLTPVHIEMGEEAFGISAGSGSVKYTLRTWEKNGLADLLLQVEDLVGEIARRHSLDWSFERTQHFAACYNSKSLSKQVRSVVQALDWQLIEPENAFRFGEDFGLFTQQFDGLMFGLGAGNATPPLHSVDYDFPDELIDIGAMVFLNLVQELAVP